MLFIAILFPEGYEFLAGIDEPMKNSFVQLLY